MHAILAQATRQTNAIICAQIKDLVNDVLHRSCAAKVFEQTTGNCASGGGATAPVDLVVVIDTSGSMTDEATDLSNKSAEAIKKAKQSCPSDLRVAWFGIEGTWPGTNFSQSYRDYLHGLGVPETDIVGTPKDQEDGAAAVMDLSDHFNWRPGAARAIFYLGDEALEGGNPQDADDVTAANAAIATAQSQGVKVFTYYGSELGVAPPRSPDTVGEYARLAAETGGQAFVEPVDNLGGFQAVLEKVICGAGVEVCQTVDEPKIVPCVRLRWGDGPQDHLETNDTEILCVTVCNPYSNVVLKDFTMQLTVTDTNFRPVLPQPDGTPSVQVKPGYEICFGDIPPCDPKRPDPQSCVSREVVLLSSGAIAGKYDLFVIYCFNACFTMLSPITYFELELVKS
jgi:hypothetical protein